MKSYHFIVGLLVAVVMTACGKSAVEFPPVHLFLEPTEEILLQAPYLPDFVNYPDDRVKRGLRGDVDEVAYPSVHRTLWLFYPNGKLAAECIVYDGGWNKELNNWMFNYENSGGGGSDIPNPGNLEEIITRKELVNNRWKNSSGKSGSLSDSFQYDENGRLQTRSGHLFKNVSYVKQYVYNDKGICTDMYLTETGSSKKSGNVTSEVRSGERGEVSRIYFKNVRIPVHGLTIGERTVFPVYDKKGKMTQVRCLSVPHNMEAYNIDSISSCSKYEYNAQGDVSLWHYTDTVYPQGTVNEFDVSFDYVYDKQGNWIEKHIFGAPNILNLMMNGYYRGTYDIAQSTDEQGNPRGEVVIKREITYFSERSDKENSPSQEPAEKKSGSATAKPKASAGGLSDRIDFVSENLGAWKVTDIRCKGPKNGGYAFVISGTFVKDCSGYSMGSVTHSIGVKEKSKQSLTSVGAYMFPRGKAGDKFSFEIVGAYDGVCDVNDFEHLVILAR